MQADDETEEVEIEPLDYWADKHSVAAPVPTAYKTIKGKEKGKDQRDKGKPWSSAGICERVKGVSLCTHKGQYANKEGKGWWQPGMRGDETS